MIPSKESMQKLTVLIFGANKERTDFDVLVDIGHGNYTQGILKITKNFTPVPSVRKN